MNDGVLVGFFSVFYVIVSIFVLCSIYDKDIRPMDSFLHLIIVCVCSPIVVPMLLLVLLGKFLHSKSPRELLNSLNFTIEVKRK